MRNHLLRRAKASCQFSLVPVISLSLFLGLSPALMQATRADENQTDSPKTVPPPDAHAAQVVQGYRVEVAVPDLNFPTSLEFDGEGNLLIAEAGKVPGYQQAKPRILRIDSAGQQDVLIDAGLESPVTDLLWYNSRLYISHRGKISVWEAGRLQDIVTGLPSLGDHQNNQITAGPDGKLYFGQGTATNSGVVGPDNAKMGWLKKHPEFHDVLPMDLAKKSNLKTRVFASPNPLTDFKGDTRLTSAFAPFGEVRGDKPLHGETKANGTILRMDPDGSHLEVYAYGFRNPFGVLWGTKERLYATENGFDVRGSRPIANDWEDLYAVKKGGFYGWPDFGSGVPVSDPHFEPMKKGMEKPKMLFREHPPVELPLHQFPKHSAIAKLDVSPGGAFGYEGQLFIAFYGHWTPMTGQPPKEHGGHRVVRFNPRGGGVEEFFSQAHNQHFSSQKSSMKKSSSPSDSGGHAASGHQMSPGPRRPIDVRFAPDGAALYIVDFGALEVSPQGQMTAYPNTGVVWKIVPTIAANRADD